MSGENGQKEMLMDILKEAIAIEIFGQEYYSRFYRAVSDKDAKDIFRGLLLDEEEHQMVLENEYEKIAGEPVVLGELDEVSKEKARRIFSGSHEPFNISRTKDILKLGIKTEENSIEMYSESAQKTDIKSSKNLLLNLVRFEKMHKTKLEGMLSYLENEGSWHGYSFFVRWFRSGLTG